MNSPRLIPAAAYIFDIDGTLLNSRDAVHYNAFRHALKEIWGVDSDLSDIPVHGKTDVGILRAVLEKENTSNGFSAKLPRALQLMRSQVEKHRAQLNLELCPSVQQLLATLKQEKKLLGVASGNLESIAWVKLQAAGLRHYFSFGSFSDAHESRSEIFQHAIAQAHQLLAQKPSTSGNGICVVGDTPADILAARANRVPIIAVATGIYSRNDLAAHQPDLCLDCCTELL